MWLSILAILEGLLKAIPVISKWFTKTAQQRREEIEAKNQAERDRVSQGGRPS